MTLEQLVMYLWHDMPVTGWIAILAFVSMLGGLAIYLDGMSIMRANRFASTSISARPDGTMVTSTSCGIGNDCAYGRRISRRGLEIVAVSSLAFCGAWYHWSSGLALL